MKKLIVYSLMLACGTTPQSLSETMPPRDESADYLSQLEQKCVSGQRYHHSQEDARDIFWFVRSILLNNKEDFPLSYSYAYEGDEETKKKFVNAYLLALEFESAGPGAGHRMLRRTENCLKYAAERAKREHSL